MKGSPVRVRASAQRKALETGPFFSQVGTRDRGVGNSEGNKPVTRRWRDQVVAGGLRDNARQASLALEMPRAAQGGPLAPAARGQPGM